MNIPPDLGYAPSSRVRWDPGNSALVLNYIKMNTIGARSGISFGITMAMAAFKAKDFLEIRSSGICGMFLDNTFFLWGNDLPSKQDWLGTKPNLIFGICSTKVKQIPLQKEGLIPFFYPVLERGTP